MMLGVMVSALPAQELLGHEGQQASAQHYVDVVIFMSSLAGC